MKFPLFPIFLSAVAAFARSSLAFSPVAKLASSHAEVASATRLCATSAETEVDRLRRKARELLEEVRQAEHELHVKLIEKKQSKDDATDKSIAYIFPEDSENDIDAVVDRLHKKRLASDTLVTIVERLHEREVAARGLEHVEPSLHHQQVIFKRVAEGNDAELIRVQGLVNRLIEAAEVLDKEFRDEKSNSVGSKITHTDMMHWGGGKIAQILTDKSNALGREHDEQFQTRLESFYEAARRKHTRNEFTSDSWREGDMWDPKKSSKK